MKRTTKEWLKQYPYITSLLNRIYTAVFHVPRTQAQIRKQILRNLKQNNSVFFVQVGSNDGVKGDPLHDLINKNKDWEGIFIEPVGYLYGRLKLNYGDAKRFIFENIAIGPSIGMSEFFYVSEKAKHELGDRLPYWFDQLGSFDRNHILKHLDGILEPYILSEEIKTIPLVDLLEKHKVTEIDLIHIDTEGYDYQVLSTVDFSKYKPSVILYEHEHLSDIEKRSAESLLNQNGPVGSPDTNSVPVTED